MYSGASGELLRTLTPTSTWYRFGLDARLIGDTNGDGAADVLVGAPGGGFNGPPPGRVFVMAWGGCAACADCPADLDDDCTVGVLDPIALIGLWG